MRKLENTRFLEYQELGYKKITVYMNEGHKWMLEELAHEQRDSQKNVLFDILQFYWDTQVPHTKKV